MSKCSFCKSKESEDNRLLAGDNDIFICENCVTSAYKIFFGDENKAEGSTGSLDEIDISKLSPKFLKSKLDDYIIGQESAKKVFSVAIYNHYKRLLQEKDDVEIGKSNVLFIGPTGSGKTLMAQTMAKHLNVPLAIADATSLTEAGYVGEDVENIVTKLLQAADGDLEKAQRGIIFIDEVDKIARLGENRSITRDVSGEGVQQALLKIVEGSVINIPPKGGRKHPNQEFLQIDTTGILFICGGAFDGIEDIIKKRLGGNVLGFNQTKRTKKEEENLLSQIEPDDLVHFGLIPELIGRLHMVGTLNELTEDDMVKILQEPKNSLIKQYQKLFEFDGVTLNFDDDAMKEIAILALSRKTGARGLRTILEGIMLDIMYELPEYRGYEIIVTKEVVLNKAKPTYIKNKKSA